MCEQKRYGRLILTGTELLVADIFYNATTTTTRYQLVDSWSTFFEKKSLFTVWFCVVLLLCRLIFRAFVQIDIDLHFVGNKPHLGFIPTR